MLYNIILYSGPQHRTLSIQWPQHHTLSIQWPPTPLICTIHTLAPTPHVYSIHTVAPKQYL